MRHIHFNWSIKTSPRRRPCLQQYQQEINKNKINKTLCGFHFSSPKDVVMSTYENKHSLAFPLSHSILLYIFLHFFHYTNWIYSYFIITIFTLHLNEMHNLCNVPSIFIGEGIMEGCHVHTMKVWSVRLLQRRYLARSEMEYCMPVNILWYLRSENFHPYLRG